MFGNQGAGGSFFTNFYAIRPGAGIDKGEDFSALSPQHFPQIEGYYVFGQSSQKIMRELKSQKAQQFSDLPEAFQHAVKQAQAGHVILLSPGCASFDQFDNYQHRGQVFRDLVAKV